MNNSPPKEPSSKKQQKSAASDSSIFLKACTKNGSKDLQTKLQHSPGSEFIQMAAAQISSNCHHAFTDIYANYFCQKLFAKMNAEQLEALLDGLLSDTHKFRKVCCDSKGTHSIQCLLEFVVKKSVSTQNFELFLQKQFQHLAFDKHGTHVIVKFIQLSASDCPKQLLFNEIIINFLDLSFD